MIIKRLEVENIKRVERVVIEPGDSPLVIVGGMNGHGKTSLLDAIPYAMAGKRAWPERPLRDGADRGRVLVDCGELNVTRTFTPGGGGTLTATNGDGMVHRTPQRILDAQVNNFNFDPLAFLRARAADQAAQLRTMVGLDTSDLDARLLSLKASLSEAKFRQAEAQRKVDAIDVPPNTPEQPIDMSLLARQLAEADAHNRGVDDLKRIAKRERDFVAQVKQSVSCIEGSIERLRAELAKEEVALDNAMGNLRRQITKAEEAESAADAAQRVSVEDLLQRHAALQRVNEAVGLLQRRREREASLANEAAKVQAAKAEIAAVENEGRIRLSAARFPVAGLGVDGQTVTFCGVPLDQASSAEQLRVSVAMGLALNPDLRVLLIRDGSLLDDDNLALVRQMAVDANAQIWAERVGHGPECTFVMVNGRIASENDTDDGDV